MVRDLSSFTWRSYNHQAHNLRFRDGDDYYVETPTNAHEMNIRLKEFWVVFRLNSIDVRCAIICSLVPFKASRNAKEIINYSPLIVI